MKEKKYLIIIIIVVILALCLIGIKLYSNKQTNNDLPKENKNTEVNNEKPVVSDEYKSLYDSLLTDSKEYGFYLDHNISIETIKPKEFIPYVLEEYININKIKLSPKLSECLEYYEVGLNKKGRECLNKNVSSIKKSDLDNYIKSKFNTERVFTLSSKKGDHEIGNVYGFETGTYVYNVDDKAYYVGYTSRSGSEDKVHTNFIKMEQDENNIYFYDNMILCSDWGGYFCANYITNENPREEEAVLYLMEDEDGNYENKEEANKALKTITEIDEDGEEYSYEVVNYDYLFENRKDKLNTYKHTFRKGNDGNYYWYSTELVNNN